MSGFLSRFQKVRYRPRTVLHPISDLLFQKDNKVIKELKDGNTGLPFNMEYSGLAAFLDLLKDPNAIDDRKMLVSSHLVCRTRL